MTPLHLGSLHPVEQVLTFVLAFGPFVVLAVVVVLRRRADEREARAESTRASAPEQAVASPGDQRDR